MAFDRSKAKAAASEPEDEGPELQNVLIEAKRYQHALAQEKNRHAEAMRRRELGWVGILIGGESIAPLSIASIVVIAGIMGAGFCLYAASEAASPVFWAQQAKLCGIAVSTGLSFIFGRSGKDNSK